LNSKLHAVCDEEGRPLVMLLSEGQMRDYKRAALMLDGLPPAKALLGDRGYDAGRFCNALAACGIAPCIPSKVNQSNRKTERNSAVRADVHADGSCIVSKRNWQLLFRSI
jgi:transposase